MKLKFPPYLKNEADLLARAAAIEGLSFSQLASQLNLTIPSLPNQRKGWVGQAIELALGTTAGSKALPDFHQLGIELKTIPLNDKGKPAESTYITHVPLLTIQFQQWPTSQCYQKLKRVLWVPVEGCTEIPFGARRIGRAQLWSPTAEEEKILAQDWQELTNLIALGQLAEITASIGEYLHIRPKAANARSVCYGFDAVGNKILTLPRGFYLRSVFTKRLF